MANEIKSSLLVKIPKKENLSLDAISTSSLVATVLSLNRGYAPPWQLELMVDKSAQPCGLNLSETIALLNKRRTFQGSYGDINNTAQKLSVTNVVKYDYKNENNKPEVRVGFFNDKTNEIVKTYQLGGYTCPADDKEVREKIEATVFVNAVFFPLVSTNCQAGNFNGVKTKGTKLQHIDYEQAQEMSLPVSEIRLAVLPDAPRRDLIDNTVLAVMKNEEHRQELEALMPEGVIFNKKKAKFEFASEEVRKKLMRVFKVTNCDSLYYIIFRWRALRGSDYNPRHEVTSGSYYGVTGRGLYSTSYVVHDIIALGARLNVKVLEINGIDGVITSHVCHSLVAQGWIIRMVGPSIYPVRKDESKGIFSYSPVEGRYLRFCVSDEDQPSLVKKSLVQTTNLLTVIDNAVKIGLDNYAIPFMYVYVQEVLRVLPPEYFMFPTAHAHNGHVIIVKAKLQEDSGYHFDFQKYLQRISDANTKKTFYYLTREPYWNQDPFGHRIEFYLRNRVQKEDFMGTEKKLVYVDDPDDEPTNIYQNDSSYMPDIKIEGPEKIKQVEELKDVLSNRLDVLEEEQMDIKSDQIVKDVLAKIEQVEEEIVQEQRGRQDKLVVTTPSLSLELRQNADDEDQEERFMSIESFAPVVKTKKTRMNELLKENRGKKKDD